MCQEYQKLIKTEIFPGYAKIVYAKPLTGYSGESTVHICWLFAHDAKKPERTVVVKFDKPEKLEREYNNYNRYIKDKIHRPSFFVEPTRLWPDNDNPRVLLYQYAGELAPEGAEDLSFDQYCKAHLLADDIAGIKAILDKTFEYLKEFYNLAPQTVQRVRYDELYSRLGDPSIEERMKRSPKKLYDIPLSQRFTDIRAALCELLQERVNVDSFDVDGFNLLNPLTHIGRVLGDEAKEPELYLRCGVVFGDLNLRNLLVIGGNPCLIDYECMTDKEHLARDFVHLEMDWLLHVLTPHLQDNYPDDWRRTYLNFASGLYAVTQAGLNETDIEHDAPAYTPPEDDFLHNGFILLGHLRSWAREFTYERGYRRSYKSRDYMAALYAEALGCLRHENLDPCQRWTALMTASVALTYLLDEQPPIPIERQNATARRYLHKLVQEYTTDYEYIPLSGRALIEPELRERRRTATGEDIYERLEDIRELTKFKQVILTGAPGSGKSTTLKRLAVDNARRILGGESAVPIPIFANLANFSSLDIESCMKKEVGDELADHLDEYLREGRCLVLWDALNEMLPKESYDDKVRALQEYMTRYTNNHFVSSCRTLDYLGGFSNFRLVEINPLDLDKVRAFIMTHLGAEGAALLRDIETTKTLGADAWELLKSPLILRILYTIHVPGQPLPRNRGRIFEQFVQKLQQAQRYEATGLRLRPLPWLPEAAQNQALSELAYRMMAASESRQRAGTVIGYDGAVGIIDALQLRYPEGGRRKQLDAEELLAVAAGETLLEISWNTDLSGKVKFWHHQLQEYFAALKMQNVADEDLTHVLKPPWWLERESPAFVRTEKNRFEPLPPPDPTGWEETIIMLTGIHPAVDKLIYCVLRKNPILAGRCLNEGLDDKALARLEGIKADVVKALVETVENPQVALRVRIAAGDVLGFLGDPRLLTPQKVNAHGASEKLIGREDGKGMSVMVKIPAGEFLMGASPQEVKRLLRANPDWSAEWFKGEQPQRRIYLDEYWIDKYPVTNWQYHQFIKATGYLEPFYWDSSRYNKPNQPVVGVSWEDAMAYCEWAGKSLPTEAQWEKAARGTDGRVYPWGSRLLDYQRANYALYVGNTTPVGLYLLGASPYGVMDMAGNVWEWCADWYDDNYYRNSPARNPEGPNTGQWRVLRGGSWDFNPDYLRCAERYSYVPTTTYFDIGFRCSQER